MDKDKIIQELLEQVQLLTFRLEQAEKRIAELEDENEELKSRLSQNSKNSSRPPSSDGYNKQPAFAKKRKGKKGGQKGHKGNTLHQVKHPDKIVECSPENCDCGHEFTHSEIELAEKRQVFDLPEPRLDVTEYQLYQGECPDCGKKVAATPPPGVNAPAQYGNRIKAYAVLLNVNFKLPFKKIQLLFKDLFGYPINESTIVSAQKQCFQNLQSAEQQIKFGIISQSTAHADETGIRVNGKLHWLHTLSTDQYTYQYVHSKRGRLALESSQSILDKLRGWLVHDCWSSYFKFKNINHAVCNAHILRELQGLIENHKTSWAQALKTLLMKIYEMPFEERVKQRPQIESAYSILCSIGNKSEPLPTKHPHKAGRYKRTKGRNLVERLIREKQAVLAFAFNRQVPFTNNLAERDIRPAKIKLKISNCFRSPSGADIYARIESFVSTVRKQNRHVFKELCLSFDDGNFCTEGRGS